LMWKQRELWNTVDRLWQVGQIVANPCLCFAERPVIDQKIIKIDIVRIDRDAHTANCGCFVRVEDGTVGFCGSLCQRRSADVNAQQQGQDGKWFSEFHTPTLHDCYGSRSAFY